MPKDTLTQPCDIVIVVEEDKEFKVHKPIPLEARLFFQKLLNSDMKGLFSWRGSASPLWETHWSLFTLAKFRSCG